MKKIRIVNITKGNVITEQGLLVDNFLGRFKGLMGKEELLEYEGMCIKPCKSIHTFFMKFSIDAVFIDNKGRVCKIIQDLKPWKISGFVKNAQYVIEIPEGKSAKIGIEEGDVVQFSLI